MRRICNRCHLIIYRQQQHECQQQQQQQQNLICKKCRGPHAEELPCYIQPLKAEEDSDEEDQQPQKKRQSPIRLCFFDAETSQDENIQISCNINGYKHVPILIIAEVFYLKKKKFFLYCLK